MAKNLSTACLLSGIFWLTAAQQSNAEGQQSEQKRRLEERTAMVLENWAGSESNLATYVLVSKCEIVDRRLVEALLAKTQDDMRMDAWRTGLTDLRFINENITRVVKEARNAADIATDQGACERMAPATRARLRQMIEHLTGYPSTR